MTIRKGVVPLCAVALLSAGGVTVAETDAPRAIAISAIHFYQRALAPLADRAGARCRFTPTCSHYAEAVIKRDGIVHGGWKSLERIARCGPWTRTGSLDPP